MIPPAAAPPRPERVAGMREQMLELVGLVRRVDGMASVEEVAAEIAAILDGLA